MKNVSLSHFYFFFLSALWKITWLGKRANFKLSKGDVTRSRKKWKRAKNKSDGKKDQKKWSGGKDEM